MFKEIIKLIRVKQWYKNALIFIAILFSGNFLDFNLLLLTIVGFFLLSITSSANYIINDIIDKDKDKKHPEKKNRPIASGAISVPFAYTLFLIFLAIGLIGSFLLSVKFFLAVLAFFILTQAYSLGLKNEPFLDVILIGANFVLRAASGGFLLNLSISYWLIFCSFFLALFLAFSKRKADLMFLKEPEKHKKVLKYYTIEMVDSFKNITTTILIIAYSLYVVTVNPSLILSIPFALYAIFRYFYLVHIGSIIGRHPEYFYTDVRLLVSFIAWGAIVGFTFYGIQLISLIF